MGNLLLNGGVFEGSGTFTRSLGTASGQVQFGALGGGFAAAGGPLVVTLAGGPDPLVWGTTPSFLPAGAPLLFGSTSATDVVALTNNINLNDTAAPLSRTVSVADNTTVTTDKAILNGVLSNSASTGGLTKTGTGILELAGANTFTGPVTVSLGTLQFSTVSDSLGAPSNLGRGTDGIVGRYVTSVATTLSFIGSTNQSTNRVITAGGGVTGSTTGSILDASGTGGATVTFAGAINTDGNYLILTGNTTSGGVISGGIVQTGIVADIYQNSGTWTLQGTTTQLADDYIVTGATTVLNLNSTGVLGYLAGTSNGLYGRSGSIINLNANDVNGVDNSGGLDFILLGDTGVGLLNTNGFNLTTLRLDVGDDDVATESATVTGSGTITITTATAGTAISLYRGSVEAKLAGPTAIYKAGAGDVTLTGDNTGITGTVATRLDAGNLILDYTASNTNKINAAAALDLRGGTLTITGNASSATTQNVASLTLASGRNQQDRCEQRRPGGDFKSGRDYAGQQPGNDPLRDAIGRCHHHHCPE